MGDVKLPSLPTSVENMTRDSLRSFIPQLIRIVEKRDNPEFGTKGKKPEWWPVCAPWAPLRCDIRDTDSRTRTSWTEELRNIVRCCYRYHNSEHLLHEGGGAVSGEPAPTAAAMLSQQLDIAAHSNFNGKVPASLEAKIPVAPGSLMCEVSLSPLPKYFIPSGDVPEQAPLYAAKAQSQVRTSARLERKRGDDLQEIFVCHYCENEFRSIALLKRHQNVCFKGPNTTEPSFEIPACPPSANVEQIHVDHLPRVRKVDLTERLGLLPLSKAKVVRKQKSRIREIQITKLDDGEKDNTMKSPTTPRAKSLISQLSRDFSPPAKARRKSLFSAPEGEVGEAKSNDISDAESVSSKTSEKTGDGDHPKDPWNKEKRTSIFSIDFSSPLGTRVVKLMNQQAEKMFQYAEETTSNYEDFCRTPKKSDLIRRLRDRKDLITFKKNRRICPKWAHSYKFTFAERKEWYRTIRTGLNARSRPLRKLLKKCSVRIQRLTKEEIQKWTTPKPRPYANNKQLNVLDAYQMQRLLQQQSSRFAMMASSPGSPRNVSPVLGLRMNGNPNSLLYKSVLSEMQADGSRFLMSPRSPGTPGRSYDLLRGSPVLKTLLNRSPEQLRTMSGAYPVPNGIYANTSNRQVARAGYDVPRAVAASVVRNLHQQMNYGHGMNRLRANQNTDLNGIKPSPSNRCVQKVRTTNNNPIVIDDDDDDDDDVYSVSSSESGGRDRSRSPPTKRRRVETETSLLFKCHLCGEELTCRGSFAAYIEKHFADRHNVRTIQLIEHIDQNGQKVVSIVEKQVANGEAGRDRSAAHKAGQTPALLRNNKTPMTPHNERENVARPGQRLVSRPASLSPKARVKLGAKQASSAQKHRSGNKPARSSEPGKRKAGRSQTDSSPVPVICID